MDMTPARSMIANVSQYSANGDTSQLRRIDEVYTDKPHAIIIIIIIITTSTTYHVNASCYIVLTQIIYSRGSQKPALGSRSPFPLCDAPNALGERYSGVRNPSPKGRIEFAEK
jgi:hypothetical protein